MIAPASDCLRFAEILEREADEDFAAASWLMDRTTERCREKRAQARKLREAAAAAREVAAIQAEADRELMRRAKKARVA